MRSKLSQRIAAAIVLVCVVCPVLEIFDCWDKTVQTGSDTEYAFVILALCLGLLYSFAGKTLRFQFHFFAIESIRRLKLLEDFLSRSVSSGLGGTFLPAISPPPALRI